MTPEPQQDPQPGGGAARAVGLRTRLVYGLGGASTGIINNGFLGFLLLYYNHVLGVPGVWVGWALALALVFDAISDPLVGYASDHLHSRWGRRHPFMYFAIAPLSLLVYWIWNPPASVLGDPHALFVFLVATGIPIRLLLTFFEVPHAALVPELTDDYDERTNLAGCRVAFYWFALTALTIALYGYWLRDTSEHPDGLLNPGGYGQMGIASALLVFVSMLASAGGLHRFIPRLKRPPERGPRSLTAMYRKVFVTFSDRSLRALLLTFFLIASANCIANALWAYLYSYFWGLSTAQMSGLAFTWGMSGAIALLSGPLLVAGREKKSVCSAILVTGLALSVTPIWLRLADLFPANESGWLYPILFVHSAIENTVYVMLYVMVASMMADVVEGREIVTGRREEGMLYAAQTLIYKITSAIGMGLGGVILDLIHFPSQPDVAGVPAESVRSLGMVYAPSVWVMYALALLALTRFRLSRSDHQAHLARLRAARARDGG
ncbi:MAG: MFS transporter [Myxococcales bacterium]|nr:MFS transporter [Myxococcales bacterium]MDH5566137.1 MFS transporter [Myxococcales bacterium]